MTTHLAKNIPYRDSKVPYGATKNDIEEMLKEGGAIALRWTETPDSMNGVALPILEFIFQTEVRGVQRKYGVKIQPPLLVDKRRRSTGYGSHIVEEPNRNASMRLLYWYLKAKLEAVRFGLDDTFNAFMAHIINQLPDGTSTTLSETFKEHSEVLREILPTFEIRAPKLEDKREVEY